MYLWSFILDLRQSIMPYVYSMKRRGISKYFHFLNPFLNISYLSGVSSTPPSYFLVSPRFTTSLQKIACLPLVICNSEADI